MVYFLSRFIMLFLTAIWVLMIVRAVLSWIPMEEETPFLRFVYYLTEPLLIPVRALLSLFMDVESCPVDVAFFVVFALLGLAIRLMANI